MSRDMRDSRAWRAVDGQTRSDAVLELAEVADEGLAAVQDRGRAESGVDDANV